MRGIRFEYNAPPAMQNPNRLDVACFFGLARAREGVAPQSLQDWLEHSRWIRRFDEAGVLRDLPVPLHSWEEFAALFHTTRLDSHAEVSSEALAGNTVEVPADAALHVVVDGVLESVALPVGNTSWADLTVALDSELAAAEARLDERDGERFLVLRRLEAQQPGAISVFSNPLLGFPIAAKDQNYSLLTYLAAAVRAFFREGGQKCYVVAMGAPEVLDAGTATRLQSLSELLWGDRDQLGARDAAELGNAYLHDWAAPSAPQHDWHGPAHLHGLDEVTWVALPDIPDLVGELARPASPPPLPPTNTVFVECTPEPNRPRERLITAPEPARCDRVAWRAWARLAAALRDYLPRVRSDLQLVLALPWPDADLRRDLPEVLQQEVLAALDHERLQLGFPWLKTRDAAGLPGAAEPADGALAGVLARGARTKGPYRSVGGERLPTLYDVAPRLPQSMDSLQGVMDRVSWFGRHPRGWQLYSDVTTKAHGALRHGAVRRLFILLVRAARNEGWARVFEPNGPATWRMVERNLSRLLGRIYGDNGLRGRTPADAFRVQCDRSVMTPQDIDTGRMIGVIQVQPAVPINEILIALSLNELGQVEAQEVAA